MLPQSKAKSLVPVSKTKLQEEMGRWWKWGQPPFWPHGGSLLTGAVQISHFFAIRIARKYGRTFSIPRRKTSSCLAWGQKFTLFIFFELIISFARILHERKQDEWTPRLPSYRRGTPFAFWRQNAQGLAKLQVFASHLADSAATEEKTPFPFSEKIGRAQIRKARSVFLRCGCLTERVLTC